MNLTPGTKLGPYEIVSLLGAGGMGEVYRARDSRLKREVAIKVLPQATSLDPERLRRFEQEALATAALNHPNILAVFDMARMRGRLTWWRSCSRARLCGNVCAVGRSRRARLSTMRCRSRMGWLRRMKRESFIA